MESIQTQILAIVAMLRSSGYGGLATRVARAFRLAEARITSAFAIGADDTGVIVRDDARGVAMVRGAVAHLVASLESDDGKVRACGGADSTVSALVAIARMDRDVLRNVPLPIGRGKGGRDRVSARLARAVDPVKVSTPTQGIRENGWRIEFRADGTWSVDCYRWRDGSLARFPLGNFPMLTEALEAARNVDAPARGEAPQCIRKLKEVGVK